MRRVSTAAAAALLLATAAHAQDEPVLYREFQNWGVYRYSDYCRAIAQYQTSTLAIAYEARRSLAVLHLRSQALRTFEDAKEYRFGMVLLQNGKSVDSLGQVSFTAINKSDFVGAMASMESDRLFEELSRSTAVAFTYDDRKIEAVELGEIGTVLNALKACEVRR